MDGDDGAIRAAVFAWLREQLSLGQDVVHWSVLKDGFRFQGETIHLVGQRGIWIPRQFDGRPASIRTTFNGPYDDDLAEDGFLLYRFQGTDPFNRDNCAMRPAMESRVPLVYFYAVSKGWYMPVFPVFVAGEDRAQLSFRVAVDPAYGIAPGQVVQFDASQDPATESPLSVRRYILSVVRTRLHQGAFREQVLGAYHERCSLCRLAHRELLDAAHIIPDREPGGDPIVPNGLSMCKIHHAAFDRNFIGIAPDYTVEVNDELLHETDGPMLRHGIQDLHGHRLIVPRREADRPDRERLARRYEQFRRAG
ncbi:MAG: HNH endonuclease [Spirochaetota bacterium]